MSQFFIFLAGCQNIHNFIFPMNAVFIIKFGPERMKCVGVAFCNFQAHMVLH